MEELKEREVNHAEQRIARLVELLDKVKPAPSEWLVTPSKNGVHDTSGKSGVALKQCTEWATLVNSWRKAMHWIPGLDRGLSVMLASVVSTMGVGDQIWIILMSPPSTGKSTLAEALSVNRKYILPKDTLTGFHSGFRLGAGSKEDFSLVAEMKGKTLIIKDGDALLKAPNREQILAEARGLYDSAVRTYYRGGQGRNYENIRGTLILCGTASLQELDASELGARFVYCHIMDHIDDDEEDQILLRVANRVRTTRALEVGKVAQTLHSPAQIEAMALTGGYVQYLRENATRLLEEVVMEDEEMYQCVTLGKFMAYMRARPARRQDEAVERELAARLVSQMVRLAHCLAVVLNRTKVDAEVMRRVTHCALDTARGKTLNLVRRLAPTKRKGTETTGIALMLNMTEIKALDFIHFLTKIGVLEHHLTKTADGRIVHRRWRLVQRVQDLYEKVISYATAT